ncbi:MAG: methionine--tRNA ligase, partial [archaeon]
MVDSQVVEQNAKVVEQKEVAQVMDPKLSYDNWKKTDLRVGLIELVEDIPNKDKLYKFIVDFATEKRIILAGLKQFYSKEELQGKKAVFVFNLAPAKLAGIESNGMILAAHAS